MRDNALALIKIILEQYVRLSVGKMLYNISFIYNIEYFVLVSNFQNFNVLNIPSSTKFRDFPISIFEGFDINRIEDLTIELQKIQILSYEYPVFHDIAIFPSVNPERFESFELWKRIKVSKLTADASFLCFEQWVMALRLRSSKDVKKSSYYVWYLGAREAKGVDAMPGAIAYLLERERLQEPFKVTLQVSGTISEIRFRGRKYREKKKKEKEINCWGRKLGRA